MIRLNSYKFLTAICFIIFSINFSYGQSPDRINLKGFVHDTLKSGISAVTVMLLDDSDSTLVKFTTTNRGGEFSFNNVKNNNYLLKLSHVSFMPREIKLRRSNLAHVDLGSLPMHPISEVLMEVVVRAAQTPISFRGDTVEYDARMFRVPPGSSVEDMLRRLPGIEVDEDGNISAQGEDIGRVLVDGRIFFSDDPRVVTRNLEAEAVSRVQIFNQASEQERLTGIDDGRRERVMNLELKEDFKQGYFGKASAGGGWPERWSANGSYNRFSETQQLSLIGFGNNLNQTTLNWEDYSEFRGVSFANYDDGDFGFTAGSRRWHGGRYHERGYHFDGRGFTENYGAGINYNYFSEKSKLNASYFYNQTDWNYEEFSNRKTFLSDTTYYNHDTVSFGQFRNSHSFAGRAEMDIDSNNTVIARLNFRLSGDNSIKTEEERYIAQDQTPINTNQLYNISDSDALSLNSLVIYNHKFNKKGRSFSASAAADINKNESTETVYNINEFFAAASLKERLDILNSADSDHTLLKSSLLYVEPFSDRISMMAFYNFSNLQDISDKRAEDKSIPNSVSIDSLSILYEHGTMFNRLGSSINYGHEGINISLGGAYQIIALRGHYLENGNKKILERSYGNFVPNFTANMQFPSNIRVYFNYQYSINEPSLQNLHPAPNLSNPLSIITGNPDLSPDRSHRFSTFINYWSRATLMSFRFSTGYSIFNTQTVYNQLAEFIDGTGFRTTFTPQNVDGGDSFYMNSWINFPILRTVLTMSLSPGYTANNTPVFINGIENITKSKRYSGGTGFNLTLGPKLSFVIRGSFGLTNTEYSIQTEQNQRFIDYSASSIINWQIFEKTYIEGNFRFNAYTNETFNQDTEIYLINLSVRQLFGENNRFEVRLAALDILNQQQYIRHIAARNYTLYREAPTLARYFMLTVSYNMRGFEQNNSGGGRGRR